MKNPGKAIINLTGFLVIFLFAASPAFSQNTSINDLKSATEDLVKELSKSMPLNSAIGLNWSDAFIGKTPPHFGIGVSAGFTTVNHDAMSNLMSFFGLEMPFDQPFFKTMGSPFPAYAAEMRLGGTAIPLDVGIKFGLVRPSFSRSIIDNFSDNEVEYDYMLIGADFRYALLNKKVFPFMLSIGLGINYLNGGFNSVSVKTVSFYDDSGSTFFLENPELDVQWNLINFEFKTQISFPFKFLTPYAGVGINYSLVDAGYEVTTEKSTGPVDIIKNAKDFTGVSEKGFEYIDRLSSFDVRAFGGFSINMVVVRLDFSGMYYFVSRGFGTTVGFRVQM